MNELLEDVFNKQSTLAWEWRTHILSILTKPLSSEDKNDADGQEYQRALDDQGEVESYLQSYAAVLADRRQALINERTLLAEHDVREQKKRKTRAAMKAAGNLYALLADTDEEDDDELVLEDDDALQPEHQVLHKELSTKRKELLVPLNGRSIKSVSFYLSNRHLSFTMQR